MTAAGIQKVNTNIYFENRPKGQIIPDMLPSKIRGDSDVPDLEETESTGHGNPVTGSTIALAKAATSARNSCSSLRKLHTEGAVDAGEWGPRAGDRVSNALFDTKESCERSGIKLGSDAQDLEAESMNDSSPGANSPDGTDPKP